MRKSVGWRKLLWGIAAWAALQGPAALGCAVCFGKTDSPMAQGMNMGIFTLMFCIGTVLAGVAGFMVFLAKRAKQFAAEESAAFETPETAKSLS